MNNQSTQLAISVAILFLVIIWLYQWGMRKENVPPTSENFYEEVFKLSIPDKDTSTWVTNRKPKNVIFLIGDGMGLTQITAGTIAKQDKLALEHFRHIGLVKTYSTKLITDSAAGATAMATGSKTYNGAIAMSVKKDTLKTILEYAEEADWATGVITTATVTHATPASFYGHQPERRNVNQQLAAQFMQKDIEVLAGGGWRYFKQRGDGRNLLEEAQDKGYFVVNDIQKIGEYIPKKLLCLVSETLPERLKVRGDFLPIVTYKSIELLDHNYERFFLMVEGAQIDWGGHKNNSQYIIEEMIDFDKAVEHALEFAKKDGNTLVIVTADHETGGYSINGGSLKDHTIKPGFTTDYHSATMVPIFAYGPGAESFTGVFDNTEIFYKLHYLMGFNSEK